MRNDYAKFTDAGGNVALVTMGNVDQAAAFRERFKLPFVCLADRDQAAYKAFDLQRGSVNQFAGPGVWLPGLKSFLRKGAGKPIGDVRQMPGSFVVDSAGVIQFAHRPDNSSQHPPHDEILAVLRSLL